MPNHFTTLAICADGYEFDCDDFNEKHKETCLCSVVKPMPEQVEQVPRVNYPDGTTEKDRRGEDTDWYEWAIKNWGTKWGTYNLKAYKMTGDCEPVVISFESAWGPPKILPEIAEWLKRTYKFTSVLFVGCDPSNDSVFVVGQGESHAD